MAKPRRILRVLLWVAGSFLAVVFILAGVLYFALPIADAIPIAKTFDPQCGDADQACKAWASFRANHPYPYQAFAGSQLSGGRALLIASEPPSDISHDEATQFVAALFADRSPHLTTRQWLTGADGYVEDILVEFDATNLADNDVMRAPDLRDRIALMNLAWYGTTYGAEVEPVQRTRLTRTGAIAPNLSVSAGEVRAWLADTALAWYAVEREDEGPHPWTNLVETGATGTFRSTDGMLVLLTFPKTLLGDPTGPQKLKTAFRRYAVASDATVGAAWTDRQVAFIGRGRTHSLSDIPPLRFETFALLAAQRSDALHQSYERNNVMAGKLLNEELADWAPIYLSRALQDTELGSLLDITDQMLKSWSEAGQIDYLYFDYPMRPDRFPFNKPLSAKVAELQKTTNTSVLFNWNTAGSAAVLEGSGQKILTVHSLGALPITYGSETKAGEMTTGKQLATFEETAYSYFAGLGDPNLARVVQYTLMYQTFRAIAADNTGGPAPPPSQATSSPSAQILINSTRDILGKLEAGTLEPPADAPIGKSTLAKAIDAARGQLADLRSHQPDMSLDRLAIQLADPRRFDPITTTDQQRLAEQSKALEDDTTQWNTDVDAYNARLDSLKRQVQAYLKQPADAQLERNLKMRADDVERQRAELDQRKLELDQRNAQIEKAVEKLAADQKEIQVFREALHEIVMASQNLMLVRDAFAKADARDISGWIRTPSYVTSQNNKEIDAVGGHDVNARALHLIPDRSITDLQIVDTPSGRQVHFNPDKIDMADHATDVSRALEHGDADAQVMMKVVATTDRAPRARNVALQMESPNEAQQWAARIGTQRFTSNAEFVTALRNIKTETPCCRILAKDANDALYLAETNTRPPPTALVTSFGDSASLSIYMARHPGGDLIALDQPIEHVKAMVTGIEVDPVSPSRFDRLKAVAGRLFGRSESSDEVLLADLRGRRGDIDPPAESGAPASERVGPIVKLAKRSASGARIEPLTVDDAAKTIGGINWTVATDGAPQAIRVRFGDGSSLDTIAGFRAGDAGKNRGLLNKAVSDSVNLAKARPESRVVELVATIKNDLKELAKDQLGRVVFVVREEGGAKMQFTMALQLEREHS